MFRELLAPPLTPDAFQVQHEDQKLTDENWASLAVFTQLMLLAISFMVGHFLDIKKVSWLGEAGFALLLGVGVGSVVKFFAVSQTFAQWISFKKEFFFIALLPPIIFDAGFSLKTKPFFSNIGAILAYAFLGTALSTFIVGSIVWFSGWIGICAPLTFLEASLFGAIVSATDPVTVLATFQRLHVDEDLYALVFGESVLNDAVAIVMYSTLTIFLDLPVSSGAIFGAMGTFLVIFLGSMVVGIAFALLSAWVAKSKRFRSEHLPLEPCLVVLCAYASYMLADGLELSGIVAILFCGMVMAQYTRPNLQKVSRDRTAAFSKMLATLAETFVFIYIGVSLFLEEQAWDKGLTWAFLGISLFSLAVSRALNVYPCTALVNWMRPPEQHIPGSHAFMLWFSGLRGAMAFALSLQAAADLPDSAGRVILTTTFFIVLTTVLINGGTTTYLVEKLGLRAGPNHHPTPHGPTYLPVSVMGDDPGDGDLNGLRTGLNSSRFAGSRGDLDTSVGSPSAGGSAVWYPDDGDEGGSPCSGYAAGYGTQEAAAHPGHASGRQGLPGQPPYLSPQHHKHYPGGGGGGGPMAASPAMPVHHGGGHGWQGSTSPPPGARASPTPGSAGAGPHRGGATPGNGALPSPGSKGGLLGKVREMSRDGYVMDKLHKLDEKYLSKLFMPSHLSEEATESEMVRVQHGPGHCEQPSTGGVAHHTTRPPSPTRHRHPSHGGDGSGSLDGASRHA